jgi:hypothetical protein
MTARRHQSVRSPLLEEAGSGCQRSQRERRHSVTWFSCSADVCARDRRLPLFNSRHRELPYSPTLMDMARQRENDDEREARLRTMMEQFRAAEKRALVKRGIALWTDTERQLDIVPVADATLPPNKIN